MCLGLLCVQLTDTRSTYDKRQTLLHYIAHVVEKLYPHQLSFYDDLDIDEAAKGELFIIHEKYSQWYHKTYAKRLFNYNLLLLKSPPSLFSSVKSDCG